MSQPANGSILLNGGALDLLCTSLRGNSSAEEKAVAMEAIAALCTHNTPSETEIARVELLTRLVGFARARQAQPRPRSPIPPHMHAWMGRL